MENLFIAATPTSPEVSFDFKQHRLSLKGESYPENAAVFYGDVILRLRKYLAACENTEVTVHVALTYFNSSSTKVLFSMFDAMNDAAEKGNQVIVHWYHDVDDDTILEFGQDLHADFPAIDFLDHATTAS
ncbi:DUF1987 domain-containing protein [Cupriavidus sp. CuC1]|uniref:DUF1987 domain-containing protein n=1 Tax=Cupriavidus TaxID=106589 RepID=UPI00296AB397|nr:DUF1987 domain-containing protein [Cupriavidus sp. CV2]MDW3688034.1 DUF1987 domain-containing protein [Cupriavidus sp. CV2]